ncbi:HAD family phosphatase [candidate division KSB1 bacterium]|nr:HAD family phosphatase [candidate division KSB1 bacterium]
MIQTSIDLIFFDLGNVLVHVDMERFVHRMAEFLGLSEKDFIRAMQDIPSAYADFECGKISAQQFYRRFADYSTDSTGSFNRFVEIYTDIFDPNTELMQACKTLRTQLRLSIISNTDELHFERIYRDYSLGDLFETPITSFETGFRKPDPAIYTHALNRVGLLPQQTLFIDDRPENVEAARQLGMQALVFTDNARLENDLKPVGLKLGR